MSSHQRSLRLQGLPLVRPEPVAPPSGSLSAEDLAKKTRHNDDLVKEILATERSYVSDIAAVIKVHQDSYFLVHSKSVIYPSSGGLSEGSAHSSRAPHYLLQSRIDPAAQRGTLSQRASAETRSQQLLVSLEAEAAKPLAERRIGGNFLKLVRCRRDLADMQGH